MIKDLVVDIFGTYTPTTYVNSDNLSVPIDGIGSLDFAYIGGVILFIIAFYSVFRIIGGLIKK